MARVQLGVGDFVLDFERQHDASELFFQVMVELVPRVVESLRDDVLPLYPSARAEWARTAVVWRPDAELAEFMACIGFPIDLADEAWQRLYFQYRVGVELLFGDWASSPSALPDDTSRPAAGEPFSLLEVALRDGVLAWAAGCSLTTRHAIRWAWRLLATWDYGGCREPVPLHIVGFFTDLHLADVPRPFVFEHEGWQPGGSTRAAAEAAMQKSSNQSYGRITTPSKPRRPPSEV